MPPRSLFPSTPRPKTSLTVPLLPKPARIRTQHHKPSNHYGFTCHTSEASVKDPTTLRHLFYGSPR
ncbi:hypothetical protein GQ44DRAFT_718455 [Phaeosphaeriaceae sp. PMI808]|nr:hypothetical protein GQ44DRAFT_718455 [Phaeosphaeriaceae sp. PMI808]